MKLFMLSLIALAATSAYGDNHWTLDVDPLGFQTHEDVLVHLTGDELEVGAFVMLSDSTWECRGVQTPLEDDMRQLLVYGDDGEQVWLRVWNHTTDSQEQVSESFTFDSSLPMLEIDMDTQSGVQLASGDTANPSRQATAYDLMGRPVKRASAGCGQIVIVNGKKHVVK